jgi:hypothetical protein
MRGECGRDDQLNLWVVLAIALRGPSNPLINSGAKTGDLVVTINPANGVTVPLSLVTRAMASVLVKARRP